MDRIKESSSVSDFINEESDKEENEYEKKVNKILNKLVIPGEVIGSTSEFISGNNTYISKNEIQSTAVGLIKITYPSKKGNDNNDNYNNKGMDSEENNNNFVKRKRQIKKSNDNNNNNNSSYTELEENKKNEKLIKQDDDDDDDDNNKEEEEETKPIISVQKTKNDICLPKIGDIVICKPLKISGSAVHCEILVVNETPLKYPFKGIINRGDISVDGEHAEHIFQCYSQQDLIKAKVLAYGNNFYYKLTTVGSNLGVIISVDENGDILEPAAWRFMYSHKDDKLISKKVSIEALTFYEELMKVTKK